MILPPLDKSNRDREYNSYSSLIKAKVVYSYLFSGLSHRSLDKNIIGLDPLESKGWQSMGILHFLGLKKEYKNIFKNTDINSVITQFQDIGSNDALLIAQHLITYNSINKEFQDTETFEREFQFQVEKSKQDNSNSRNSRLQSKISEPPEKVEVISIAFKRDPDVVAAVLERANGICEACNNNAPFLRAKDNTPYLEVHHKIRLADGGNDTVENALALCPNCHRKAHFGQNT